jgi:hypothetical protein
MTATIQKAPAQARKIATIYDTRDIRITVLTGAHIIHLAHNRDGLEQPPPFSGVSGLAVSALDGQVQIEWQGDMWVLGDPANSGNAIVEFDIGVYNVNP